MAETSRVGSQITFPTRKGSALKGNYTGYPNLHYRMFQIAGGFVQ